MLSAESRRGRRIVGSIERGAELMSSLLAACTAHRVYAGEIRAIGSLEVAELTAFDQVARVYRSPRSIGGGLELLSLIGNVSERNGGTAIVAQATLVRERDTGPELVGGHLARAVVHAVEFIIESFDDLTLRAAIDQATGASVWHSADPVAQPTDAAVAAAHVPAATPVIAPAPAIAPTPNGAVASSAADADREAATAILMARATHNDEIWLAAGDVIVHPRFQRCLVVKVEASNEFIQVQLRNGRTVRLSLEVLQLSSRGVENGQRIFQAAID